MGHISNFPRETGVSNQQRHLETRQSVEAAKYALSLALDQFSHHDEGLLDERKTAELIARQRNVLRTQIYSVCDNILKLQHYYSADAVELAKTLKERINRLPASPEEMQNAWFSSHKRKEEGKGELEHCLGSLQLLATRLVVRNKNSCDNF